MKDVFMVALSSQFLRSVQAQSRKLSELKILNHFVGVSIFIEQIPCNIFTFRLYQANVENMVIVFKFILPKLLCFFQINQRSRI